MSRFYSGYAENETDKQFDNCLKAHGHGVTIKTLYHLAKSAGVDIAILPNIPNGNLAKAAKTQTLPVLFLLSTAFPVNTYVYLHVLADYMEDTENVASPAARAAGLRYLRTLHVLRKLLRNLRVEPFTGPLKLSQEQPVQTDYYCYHQLTLVGFINKPYLDYTYPTRQPVASALQVETSF